MNVLDLYQRLKEKGYYEPDADSAATVLKQCQSDPTSKVYGPMIRGNERVLRERLELDRREVFLLWYGSDIETKEALKSGRLRHWTVALEEASEAYMDCEVESCIDWLLQNP